MKHKVKPENIVAKALFIISNNRNGNYQQGNFRKGSRKYEVWKKLWELPLAQITDDVIITAKEVLDESK